MTNFKLYLESSFQSLYDSAVEAFPQTTRRQHVTGSISINNIRSIPYLGMKTLLVRAEADNRAGGGGQYKPVIMFKDVQFHNGPGPNIIEITASDNGQTYYINPITDNDTLVRCQCNDEFFRFRHYNWVNNSLFSINRKPYIRKTDTYPPANEQELPGMCKHLMRLGESLRNAGIFVD